MQVNPATASLYIANPLFPGRHVVAVLDPPADPGAHRAATRRSTLRAAL